MIEPLFNGEKMMNRARTKTAKIDQQRAKALVSLAGCALLLAAASLFARDLLLLISP